MEKLKKLLDKQPSDAFKDWLKSIFDSDIELRIKWNNNLTLEIRELLKEQPQTSSLSTFLEKINTDDFIIKYIKVYEKHFGIIPQKEIDDIVLQEWKRKTNDERHQRIKQLSEPTRNLNQLFKPIPKQHSDNNPNDDMRIQLSQQP